MKPAARPAVCYDLELPADFRPRAADGEVESFELWPIARVVAAVRDTDAFKFNVNLVLVDLFLREGLISDRPLITCVRRYPADVREGPAFWDSPRLWDGPGLLERALRPGAAFRVRRSPGTA